MFQTYYPSIIRSAISWTVSHIWYIRAGESNCYVVEGRTSYNHVAVRLACTNVPNVWYSLLDGAPDDGQTVRPKDVEQNKGK